jgi:hypothetical protein
MNENAEFLKLALTAGLSEDSKITPDQLFSELQIFAEHLHATIENLIANGYLTFTAPQVFEALSAIVLNIYEMTGRRDYD